MNPDAKSAWVGALLSGEFERNRGALRDGDRYCPLGVLCEVYLRATGEGTWQRIEGNTLWKFASGGRGSVSWVPMRVCEWAGVSYDWLPNDGLMAVCDMNDVDGASFETVAAYVEERL